MELIQLPHLAIGAPTQITVARVPQVEMRDLLEATRRVEARGHFVGERLIVNKAIDASRTDGLLVQAHSLDIAAFNPGDLGADERRAVFEIRRAMLRPYFELPV